VAPSNAKGGASREERLAQRLRENLRRRKAQARALSATEGASDAAPDDKGDGPDLRLICLSKRAPAR
jgi:hypothetical protein